MGRATRRRSPRDRGLGLVAFVVLAVLLVPWDPVPGGPAAPAAGGQVFTAAQIQRAEDFARLARIWSWASLAVSLVVACVLGFSRLGRALVARRPGTVVGAGGRSRSWRWAWSAGWPRCRSRSCCAARALDYGLRDQAWSGFAVDLARGRPSTVSRPRWRWSSWSACARRWPRAWPAVAGALLAALVLLGSFVYPLLVEPLFNHFEPLPDGPLRTQILALADQEGVQVDDVLVADASRRTTTLNAYVSGFGCTRRVVRLRQPGQRPAAATRRSSVVAHELAPRPARRRAGRLGARCRRGVPRRRPAGLLVGAGEWPTRAGCRWCWRSSRSPPSWRARSRTASAAASRPGPTWTPCAPPAIPRRSCAAAELARARWPTRRRPPWSQWWFGSHPTALQRIALAERFQQGP